MANTKITTAVIKDDAITTAKIADDAVTGALIADDVALAGNPTTTTQSAGNNTTRIATTAFVTTAINNLVDSAPSALDTLNELAAAMGDDANFSTTVTNSIATKLPLAGGTMTGDLVAPNIKATTEFQIFSGGTDIGAIFNSGGALTIQGTSTRDVSIGSDSVTNAIFVEGTNGNVCIGSSTTDGTLHVESGSAGTITSAAAANELVLESDGPVGVSLLFDDEANDAYGNIYWGNETDGNADGRITYFGSTYVTAADRQSMVFRTAGTERMRITSGGSVLLNTASYSSLGTIVLQQLADDKGIAIIDSAAANTLFLQNNGDINVIGNNASIPMAFETSSTEVMRINPTKEIQIGGTSNAGFIDFDGTNLQLNTQRNPNSGAFVNSSKSHAFIGLQGTNGGSTITFGTASSNNTTSTSRMIIESGGNVEITNGNLKMNSGNGIDFSDTANSSGSMNSELLDDYEEGTWTATVNYGTSSGTSATLANSGGTYTKIGRLVTAHAFVNVSNTNSGSGNVYVGGLPFTVADLIASTGVEASGIISYYTAFSSAVNSLRPRAENSTKFMTIDCNTSATQTAATTLTAAIMGTGEIRLSITYFAS